MSLFKLIGIGTRNHADVAASDVGTEQEPEFAVSSQARTDKQKHGIATKDVSSEDWTVSDAEAVAMVLRPSAQDAAYNIVVPDNGLWIIDASTNGSDGSGNNATVKTSGGSSVTVNDGHTAMVLTSGGTTLKMDWSG